jgi:hypothetical protein
MLLLIKLFINLSNYNITLKLQKFQLIKCMRAELIYEKYIEESFALL